MLTVFSCSEYILTVLLLGDSEITTDWRKFVKKIESTVLSEVQALFSDSEDVPQNL